MNTETIQQPASVNEAESKAGFAAPSGSTNYDSRQETIEHILRVRELLYIGALLHKSFGVNSSSDIGGLC